MNENMNDLPDAGSKIAGVHTGTIRYVGRCGTITDETQTQSGFRASEPSEGSPRRLFFGEQTERHGLNLHAVESGEVVVRIEGYTKVVNYPRREGRYHDTSAFFVERITLL